MGCWDSYTMLGGLVCCLFVCEIVGYESAFLLFDRS